MPYTIGKCKLFRIKHITFLEGETFLRNKHDIAFFEIKRTQKRKHHKCAKVAKTLLELHPDIGGNLFERAINTTESCRNLVGRMLAY